MNHENMPLLAGIEQYIIFERMEPHKGRIRLGCTLCFKFIEVWELNQTLESIINKVESHFDPELEG